MQQNNDNICVIDWCVCICIPLYIEESDSQGKLAPNSKLPHLQRSIPITSCSIKHWWCMFDRTHIKHITWHYILFGSWVYSNLQSWTVDSTAQRVCTSPPLSFHCCPPHSQLIWSSLQSFETNPSPLYRLQLNKAYITHILYDATSFFYNIIGPRLIVYFDVLITSSTP